MACTFVYDDTVPVSAAVHASAGIDRFGALLVRKQPLAWTVLEMARRAGYHERLHLRSEADLERLTQRVASRPESHGFVYCPADLACADVTGGTLFLRKILYSDHDLMIARPGASSAARLTLLRQQTLLRLIHAAPPLGSWRDLSRHRDSFEEIDDAGLFVDLSRDDAVTRFLATSFDARFFNQLSHDTYQVKKCSTDRAKLAREYAYFRHLPEQLQPHFVQPYGFGQDGERAWYHMERLNVPNVAVQWLHGALTIEAFDDLLDRLMRYIDARPRRTVGTAAARASASALYETKLWQRLQQLRDGQVGQQVIRLLTTPDGRSRLDEACALYAQLYRRMAAEHGRGGSLALSHGDLCFSNILYDKRTGLMKLIDPRGADCEDDLFLDPYYDLAKLSHSVLGAYDHINADLCSLRCGHDLVLELELDTQITTAHRTRFASVMAERGYDLRRVRLYEASLFLSMLPLHADVPKKVAAFVLRAHAILTELARQEGIA